MMVYPLPGSLRAVWVNGNRSTDGGYHLILDPIEDNEDHEMLCGATLRERYPSFHDSIDPLDSDLCVPCAARGALLLTLERR